MNCSLKLAGVCALLLTPAADAVPQINSVLNAASYTRLGLPNSGIAPGSVFVVFGTGLGPSVLQQAGGYPLSAALGGTSIRVAVGATSLDAVLLYTSATQVAAILPSATPPGIALISVTYQGQTSEAGAVRIQRSAPGILTQNESGDGMALAQNFNSEVDQPRNGFTHAAHPGQVVTLWGTGLGASSGSDAVAPLPQDLNLNLQVLVGGKPAKVRYKGRSGCCAGVDQIIVEVPAGVEGCYVPVVVMVDNTVSNFATLSIAATGNVCTTVEGISGANLEKSQAGGTVAIGRISLGVYPDCGDDYEYCDPSRPATYDENASASFVRGSISSPATPPPGACLVFPGSLFPPDPFVQPEYLDAGPVLNISGPKGTMQINANIPGNYSRQLSKLVSQTQYLVPGEFTVDNGAGGAGVGPFKATLTIPDNPFHWTAQQSTGAARVTWSGGAPSGYVTIQGSGVPTADFANVNFICTERVAAGQFTIPAEVLMSLPPDRAGRGLSLYVASPVMTTFQSRGLDFGQLQFSPAVP